MRWLGLALLAACQPATQALLEVDLEPELRARIERVEVMPHDALWQPRMVATSFALQGPHAQKLPFSFGAVTDDSPELRLSFRAYGADVEPMLEQRLTMTLRSEHVAHMAITLTAVCEGQTCTCAPDPAQPARALCRPTKRSAGTTCDRADECVDGFCSNGICCRESCQGECNACDVAGQLGNCVEHVPQGDPGHCGGCGIACSGSHVPSPHCTGSVCDGDCEIGWGDCTLEKRTKGCATELAVDPNHCGRCGNACPYGVCRNGTCIAGVEGNVLPGDALQSFPAFRLHGARIGLSRGCQVIGLGIQAALPSSGVAGRIRLGLYERNRAASDDAPGALLVESPEILLEPGAERSVLSPGLFGGVERRVKHTTIEEDGLYWLVFLADSSVDLVAKQIADVWVSTQFEIGYDGLQGMPASASAQSPLELTARLLGGVYAITACP